MQRFLNVFLRRNVAFLADGLFTGCRDSTFIAGTNSLRRKIQFMRNSITSLVACTLLSSTMLVHADSARDQDATEDSSAAVSGTQPDGKIDFTGGSIAAGIGFSWGHGTLNFGGQSHAFKISGVSLVDVGAANVAASGNVYNLKNIADFNGNYVAMAAGMTVAGGGSAAYLKNEHGVVIKLHSTEAGLRFNLAADGIKVALTT